jgi:rhamnogalacturonan endolyase
MSLQKTSTLASLMMAATVLAKVPGGGSTGADVTVRDNGATVVLDNGIVALTVTKASATITSLTYGGMNLFSGGYDGGQLYWSWNQPNYQNPANCTYSLVSDPKADSGNRAEIMLHMKWSGTAATAAMDVDIHYALLRGNSGFYAAGVLSHPSSYPDNPGGEWRMASYPGSTFDWLSVDAKRSKLMCSLADWTSGVAVPGAPKEVELLTQGVYKGQFECKYSYSADLGEENVWGWSSTTKGIGLWVTRPSLEYYNGGPKKRELMCHASPILLNMLGGQHYGMGNADNVAAGETFRKIFGPFLIYVNQVPSGTANAPQALFADATAQALAEQAAWPYPWFRDTGYVQAAGRGTVSGTLAINDPGAPNASPAGMWIGLAPDNGTDFQFQAKTYQFWAKTGTNGGFSIPNVIPGTYALYAFGSGAPGTFKKSAVTVQAGQDLNLGTVSWKPPRTAATLWEIGTPDRDSHELLDGDSLYAYWPTSYINYPKHFPNGITYTVGKDDWSKTWNWDMMNDSASGWAPFPAWNVDFTLPKAPTATTQARFYLALASSYSAHLTASVNGTQIASFTPGNPSDAVVRLGSHGAFWDTSIVFGASLLKAGANTLSIAQTKTGEGATVAWDYLRLEADGTGITTGIAPRTGARSVSLRGSVLEGDGLHDLVLIGPSGRVLGHTAAGGTLNLSALPRGTYFARCAGETLPLAWTR